MTSDDFEKELYKNWVRGAKGLEFLQEGLHDFVGEKVKQCRDNSLQQILQTLPAGSPNNCDLCTSYNLLPDHCIKGTKCEGSTCIQRNNNKCFGSKKNDGTRRKCPKGICSKFYDKIVQHHAFEDPLWENTDPTTWCSDPLGWSYAKCFQTTVGKDSSANTTDAAGLLSILINNKKMWNSLACQDMGSNICPFYRAIDFRDVIMHSSKLEIEDLPLGFYLNIFMTVLQDRKCLIKSDKSITAVKKLVKLQSNQITISLTEEAKLVEKAYIYQQKKEQLKEDLITLYRQQYHTLPLSPLFEELDTPLLGFYVMPDLNKVEIQRSFDGCKENRSKLTTLREVFYNEENLYRNIYLLADAGLGKTAFSKRLVLTWCQAHKCIENDTEHFKPQEIDAVSQFEFVFLLSLRECSDECDIDEMIRQQIVPRLANTNANIETILSKEKCLVILDGLDEWAHPQSQCTLTPRDIPHRKAREKCAVLTTARPWRLSVIELDSTKINQKLELEGLNEKSRDTLKKNVISQYMPGATKEQVREQIGKFDSEVAAKGISDLETIPLLLLFLLCLRCDNIDLGSSKCVLYCQIIELLLKRTFTKHPELQSKNSSRLSKLPSWLTVFPAQLWAYLTSFFQTERPQCSSEIPQCFRDQELCKEHFTFLTSLGELAFERLFSETSENRLVFDSSIAEKCLKDDFLKLGRLTGIITQDKQTKLLSQIRKTSFSHKTVQEFFAALYISTYSDQDKVLTKVLSFCKSIKDILDLSKVFIFISGINAELFSLLSNELMKVINKDKKTSKYRSTTVSFYERPLKNIQDMFVSCIQEIPDNKDVTICLQDFFFDDKCRQDNYYTSLQRLALQNKTNISSIYIYRPGSRSLTEIIDGSELDDPQIQCQKLYCWCKGKEEEIIRLLSTSVKCLVIAGIQRDNECKDAQSSLTDEQCKTFHNSSQLKTINIRNSTVSHKFLNYIINVKSIKEISLASLSCSEHESTSSEHESSSSEHESSSTEHESSSSKHESSSSEHESSCPVFNFDLSQHPELKKLRLWRGNFTFCDMNKDESSLLHKMRNIEDVVLYRVKMSSLSLRWFVEIIEKLEHSVRVQPRRCEITPIEEFEDIKNYIRISESFVVEKDDRDRGRNWFQFVTRK